MLDMSNLNVVLYFHLILSISDEAYVLYVRLKWYVRLDFLHNRTDILS